MFLAKAAGQNIETPEPITREEMFLSKIGGGGGDTEVNLLDALIDRSIIEITSGATSVGSNAFQSCSALTSVNLPVATSVGGYAFNNCLALTSVDLPLATSVGNGAFQHCQALTSVNLPVATSIDGYAFSNCPALTSVDLPLATSVGVYTFRECNVLTSVILRSSTVCSLLNKNAFNNCYHILGTVNSTYNPNGDKDGYIYVPSALIEDYKVATNWSNFATQFRALEDYTVDGTITGELDESKI
jgi:hypothetical protein